LYKFGLRSGDWAMIPPYDAPEVNERVNIELGNAKEYQLYNLKSDPSQENNVAEEQPDKLKQMVTKFLDIRGEKYKNTVHWNLK
jgi:arylsulfatase A-like enzyme